MHPSESAITFWNRNLTACVLTITAGLMLGGCETPPRRSSPVQVISGDEEDAAPVTNPETKAGKTIEIVEQTYPDGTVGSRIEGWRDEDGEFVYHGSMTNFWDTGQKKSQVHYVNGIRHGSRSAWYRDGQPWNYGEYVNGKPDGTWTEWLSNGVKGRETIYVNGGLNGWLIERYPDDSLKRKVMYVNGLRQGRETIWEPDGTVLREVDYIDDVSQP